jgi:hypothetical protein
MIELSPLRLLPGCFTAAIPGELLNAAIGDTQSIVGLARRPRTVQPEANSPMRD